MKDNRFFTTAIKRTISDSLQFLYTLAEAKRIAAEMAFNGYGSLIWEVQSDRLMMIERVEAGGSDWTLEMKCPDCGETLRPENGCARCAACGWEACAQ
jgi:hypothetical protein